MKPSETPLSGKQIESGLSYVTKDGILTEAMVAFTGGTFLVAMALGLGASNFQVGLLAALPTLSNIFQLVSIWLVQRYSNRRLICVISSFFARFPLLIIGILPFVYSSAITVNTLIFLLFFHYFLGSISGASWNSWMKDLVPAEKLGNYFSYRTRLAQVVNVVLSIATALCIDFIKTHYPQYEVAAYPVMFVTGGLAGVAAVYMMSRTPEPRVVMVDEKILKRLRKPFADINFRRLLLFNVAWTFSLNLAVPFFSVYLMQSLGISLSTVIVLGIVSQISGILFLRMWGNFSDRFSNKTVIRICAPIYVGCILGWNLLGQHMLTIPILALISVISGMSQAGINLATTNVAIKLAPKEDAIVYIASRNIVNAFIPALAPILGGVLADFLVSSNFVTDYSVNMRISNSIVTLLHITNWNLFFVFSSLLAIFSLRLLRKVDETGEIARDHVVVQMVTSFKTIITRLRA